MAFSVQFGCTSSSSQCSRNTLEIHYIYQGNNIVVVDSDQHAVQQMDIVCINPTQSYWYKRNDQFRYHKLIIHSQFLEKCGISTEDKLKVCFKDPYVTSFFTELVKDGEELISFLRIVMEIPFKIFLNYLYNYQNEKDVKVKASIENATKILEFIEAHYSEDITLFEIGKALGFSVKYMCACFCQETGLSINKYINYRRCIQASKLLLKGEMSITEVGGHCGYNSMSYFSRKYHDIFGELPSETRRRTSNKKSNGDTG